ncbi:MAG: aminotransferase class IV family protein [Rhizobiaceae bacterium]
MSAESPLRDGDRAGFELIETLRWEPVGGFVRLERHLARLYASANELGFTCDPEKVGATLGNAVADAARSSQGALRIRLTLASNGNAVATAQPFALQPNETVWTLRIARTRLNSHDPLLRYKTSRRSLYETARAEFTHKQADEVILLNERGEVCEGTITTLFVERDDDGSLLTPPLTCGLLAGVLRAQMIETGKAREAVLTEAELRAAGGVFAGNSLRGLIRCKLTS